MAENQWGKSPPKGKSALSPDMIKESFWGPAEVPDQVRGTPRVTTWGGPRPWEPGDTVEGIEGGAHDSWVSGEAKKGTAQSSFEGTDLDTTGSTYEAEGIETGKGDPNEPTVREQEGGAHDSWVGGEIKKGTAQSSFEGTDLDTTGSTYEAEGIETEKGEPKPPSPPKEEIESEPTSWVGGEIKKGTAQSSFEGADLDTTGSTYKAEGLEPGKAPPKLPEFLKEEKEYDDSGTWVGGETKKGTAESSFKGTKLDLDMESWVGEFTAKKKGEKPEPRLREEIEKDVYASDPFLNAFKLDAELKINAQKSNDFMVPEITFDAPSGGGSFDPNGGFSQASSSEEHLDPFVGGWNFLVKIDNIPEPHSKFVSISGLTMETENIEFKYAEDAYMRRIPGKEKFGEVELTRIFQVGSSGFSDWRNRISQGKDDRRDVTIQVFHTTFDTKVMEIKLMDAYISKWEAPELNAGASDGATEKITLIPHHIIVNEGVSSVQPSSQGATIGADAGTPPPAPLSLEDYYKQLQEKLEAAMGRMGVTKGLEDSRTRQKERDDERKAQAEKAAKFREEQKEKRKN